MHERIIGPTRGYYAVVTALLGGDVADRYVGYGKVFDRLPTGFLMDGATAKVVCPDDSSTPEEALDAAEDFAFAEIEALPERDAAEEHSLLWALAYVSRAQQVLRADQIQKLLSAARRRNESLGITGVLLYFDEKFMQYIEGPRSKLELVYRIIRKDPLHHGLIKVMKRQVSHRVFPEWQMAFDSPIAPLWAVPADQIAPQPSRHENHGQAVIGMLSLFVQRESAREELVQALRSKQGR